MPWSHDRHEKAKQRDMFRGLGVKEYVNFQKFKTCGHRGKIGNAKAGICFMCQLKERRTYTPADSQAEMGFNTEPVGVT